MEYDVDAQVGGKIAALGSRLIDSTASSLADQFFTRFASLIKVEPVAAPKKIKAVKKPRKSRQKTGEGEESHGQGKEESDQAAEALPLEGPSS